MKFYNCVGFPPPACEACAARSAECHAKCEDYRAWRAAYDAEKDKQEKKQRADIDVRDVRHGKKPRRTKNEFWRQKTWTGITS
jgi:hypothetical protein